MNGVLASILLVGAALELSTVSFVGPPFLQAGSDLSGRWTRESAGGADGAGHNAGWGPEITVEQTWTELTVRSGAALPQRYKTDGTELWQALESGKCTRKSRVTKTAVTPTNVTITTWTVTEPGCPHGEVPPPSEDWEPTRSTIGEPTTIRPHRGNRRLESMTVVSRSDDGRLSVETTQAGLPGQPPTTTRTVYRK